METIKEVHDNTHYSPFVRSYIETALWSSTDDDGTPLDAAKYADTELAAETIAKFIADCEKFETESNALFENADLHASDYHVAHDFWLTRNRHDAGFWDGDYPEPIATLLTDLSKTYGECDLYVGDDGKIYIL